MFFQKNKVRFDGELSNNPADNYICVRFNDHKIEFMTSKDKWSTAFKDAIIMRFTSALMYCTRVDSFDYYICFGQRITNDYPINVLLKKCAGLFLPVDKFLDEIQKNYQEVVENGTR